MNLKSTEKLLKLLRAHGVTHFKSHEVELNIGAPHTESLDAMSPVPSAERVETKGPEHGGAIPPVENPIPHHLNEVRSLLKLSDEDLVDQLFPLPKPTEETTQ